MGTCSTVTEDEHISCCGAGDLREDTNLSWVFLLGTGSLQQYLLKSWQQSLLQRWQFFFGKWTTILSKI